MKVVCKYNNPNKIPKGVPSDFDYGLKLQKEYWVMGIMINGEEISYFIDENGKPGFYPKELFDVADNQLSQDWYFRSYSQNDEMYPYVQAIWGYRELVFEESHYEKIVEREEAALRLYFKRKEELVMAQNER